MKQLTLAFALALLGAAGCGGSQKPTTAAAPTCADAAEHAHAVLSADEQAASMATTMRDVVGEHCPADGWSAEAIGCITAAASHDALHACMHQLTPEQHDKLHAAMGPMEGEGMMQMKHADEAPADPCGGDE